MVWLLLLSQVCLLQIENWEYDMNEQRLEIGSNGIIQDSSFRENGEWKLINTSVCVEIYIGDDATEYSILRASNL